MKGPMFVCGFVFACWALVSVAALGDDEPAGSQVVLPPSVAELQAALEGDVQQRYDVLGLVTPRGFSPTDRAKLMELLISVLDDEFPDVRARAAESLALFGEEALPALPRLMSRIGDPEATLSFEGVWVAMSKAAAASGPRAVPVLMEKLPESDRAEYYGILAAIAEIGPEANAAAPRLIELLRTGPENRRWATVFTLSKLGEAALPAIPDYIALLDHDDFNMQVIACRALAALGPASKAAIPKLSKLMDEGILSTRTHAAMCLAAIGPAEDVRLVDRLSKLVQEPNAFSQERGMIALGRLGHVAGEAAPLVDRLIDEEAFTQKPEAALALWQITGQTSRTLEVLSRLIDDPTYDNRVYAAITTMGPAAAPMAGQLAAKLTSEDQSLRLILVEALAAMGPAAKPQLDALRARSDDSSREVAIAIDKAIAAIDTDQP